jgi:hypothetical protein
VYSKEYTFQILLGFSVTLKTSQTLTLLGPTSTDSIGVAHTLKLTSLKKIPFDTNKGTRSSVTLRFGSNFAVWQ